MMNSLDSMSKDTTEPLPNKRLDKILMSLKELKLWPNLKWKFKPPKKLLLELKRIFEIDRLRRN